RPRNIRRCLVPCVIFGPTKRDLLLFRMNSTARIGILRATSCPSGQPRSNRLATRNGPTHKAEFTWASIGTSTPKRASTKAITWLTMFSTTPSGQSTQRKRAHEKERAMQLRFVELQRDEVTWSSGEFNDLAGRLFGDTLPNGGRAAAWNISLSRRSTRKMMPICRGGARRVVRHSFEGYTGTRTVARSPPALLSPSVM